jgi:hypothetical protein
LAVGDGRTEAVLVLVQVVDLIGEDPSACQSLRSGQSQQVRFGEQRHTAPEYSRFDPPISARRHLLLGTKTVPSAAEYHRVDPDRTNQANELRVLISNRSTKLTREPIAGGLATPSSRVLVELT